MQKASDNNNPGVRENERGMETKSFSWPADYSLTEVEVIVPSDLIIISSQDSLELVRSSVEKLK